MGLNNLGNFLGSLFMPLLGVALIIALAYWSTKWLSKKAQGITSGNYITVLERVVIGQDKLLVMIELNKTVYLLGIAGQSINTICSFDANSMEHRDLPAQNADFNNILKDILKNKLPNIKLKRNDKGNDGL